MTLKTIFFTTMLAASIQVAFGQKGHQDTIRMKDVKTGEEQTIPLSIPDTRPSLETETTVLRPAEPDSTPVRRGRPIFGITFSRIDLTFTRLMDGGSFNLGGDHEILKVRPGKTRSFGFDVVQVGYRFNKRSKIFLSGGFEWTYLRLKQGLAFDPTRSPYEYRDELPEDFSRNRLSAAYIRVPVTFEIRSKQGGRLAVGPVANLLLRGTQRYRIEDGNTTIRRRGDFGFAPVQYGAFARLGYRQIGLVGKYFFNGMFDTPSDTGDLQQLQFGLTLGF